MWCGFPVIEIFDIGSAEVPELIESEYRNA